MQKDLTQEKLYWIFKNIKKYSEENGFEKKSKIKSSVNLRLSIIFLSFVKLLKK